MELNICHIYPDVLNLYGDRGNITCLVKRLEWRGIHASVTGLAIGMSADFNDFDLFFIGGGQDFEQDILLSDLRNGKSDEIKAAIEDGKTALAVCGGYQILGQYYQTWDGKQCDFTGALDLYSIGQKERLTGDYMFECGEDSGGSVIVGFENHSGKTYLGSGVKPLGRVLSGYGNNGEDGTEGARYLNTFCTYSHGPLLPKNPEFADFLISTALTRKYGDAALEPLDDTFELSAHEYMRARMAK